MSHVAVYGCSNLKKSVNVKLISGTDGSVAAKKSTASYTRYDFIPYAWMWSWYQELEDVGAKKVLWEQLGWGEALAFWATLYWHFTFTLHHLGIFSCFTHRKNTNTVPCPLNILTRVIFMGRGGVGWGDGFRRLLLRLLYSDSYFGPLCPQIPILATLSPANCWGHSGIVNCFQYWISHFQCEAVWRHG